MEKVNVGNSFHRTESGPGINDYMQNHCDLCEWKGSEHYAHNDHQWGNLDEERLRHRKVCISLLESATGCSIAGLDKLTVRGDS